MRNEWKELDPYNLPADILKPGAWEMTDPEHPGWNRCNPEPHLYSAVSREKSGYLGRYRIRRPEGWEPSGCPTCNARGGVKYHPDDYAGLLVSCPDPWHDDIPKKYAEAYGEAKAPKEVEEIKKHIEGQLSENWAVKTYKIEKYNRLLGYDNNGNRISDEAPTHEHITKEEIGAAIAKPILRFMRECVEAYQEHIKAEES